MKDSMLKELKEVGGFIGNPTAYPSTPGYVYDWSKIREVLDEQSPSKTDIKELSDTPKCDQEWESDPSE